MQPAAPQNAAGAPPWETIASAADEGALALRDVELAVSQVAEAGTQEQQAAACALPAGLRRGLYLVLAGPADSGVG